jgi:hypothetical protein
VALKAANDRKVDSCKQKEGAEHKVQG